ncbi:MAG: glycosyltransferase [Burkholderiales bacterium]|nr:glycosyltransferase [Burkholderiales bacterium]
MNRLRILYLGTLSGTCLDRAHAYRRLGHEVRHLDMRQWLPRTPWVDRITWRVGGHVFSPWLVRRMQAELRGELFDICHVDNGEWVTPAVMAVLKAHCQKVINYNIDDPTGPRDRRRFSAYRMAAPHYDLLAVVRQENVAECRALGARRVIRVWRSADELAHAPRPITPAIAAQWQSDVLFLGTWMPERGPFLLELIQRGVPVSIRGANWHKAPEWPQLQPHWKGGAIGGQDYAYAIQCASINLGLLSKGNRDLHTTRSLEIPALGGLFCAERTNEHSDLYQEGAEALFWRDAQECADQCLALLARPDRMAAIAAAGRHRFLANRHGNEDILHAVLSNATSGTAP